MNTDHTNTPPPHAARMASMRALSLVAACVWLGVHGQGTGVQAQAQLVMKVASTETSRSPLGRHLRAFALDISERSKGSTHVKIFADGVLGAEDALLSRTIDGSIQMYAGQLRSLEKVVPEVAVLSAPYVFRGDKQLHRALDRRVRRALDGVLERRGLVFGGFGGTARRALISHQPIATPGELKGAALQTERPHADLLIAALGASVAGQLATTGADGSATAPPIVDATPLRALADQKAPLGRYVLNTGHTVEVAIMVYSKRWFDGLPEDLQAELRRPNAALTAEARRHRLQQNARVLEAWSAAAVEVKEPTTEQRRTFSRAVRKVATQIANRIGIRSWQLLRAARRG